MPCTNGLFEDGGCLCITACLVLVPASEQIICVALLISDKNKCLNIPQSD